MKKVRFMAIFAIAASMVLMACEMYDDGIPAKSIRTEFKAMYPDAKDVEWEREGTYWSVSFETGTYSNRIDHEALFDSSGKWLMTQTEKFLLDVPRSVREALAASPEFGSLPVEDNEVEYYETPTGNFYRFDLVSGGRDIDVDVTEDGKVSLAKRVLF
jgi:hypothetical protein